MNCRLPVLREKTAKLTTSPGVYLMKDQKSEIIYIGKAKNLKNRVTSYFRESADHTPKVASMRRRLQSLLLRSSKLSVSRTRSSLRRSCRRTELSLSVWKTLLRV